MERAHTGGSFTVLAKDVLSADGLEEALYRLTSAAVTTFTPVTHASLTVRDKDQMRTWAPTSRTAVSSDYLQYRLNEGPCVEAVTHDSPVVATDVVHDRRWPRWGSKAAGLGIRSQASYNLYVEGRRRAALNLYSEQSGALRADPVLLALFASQVAVVFGLVQRVDQLNDALARRLVIGAAIGMVMQRYDLDQKTAFNYLARQSQDRHQQLRDVCAEMVKDADPRPQ